jgi:alpha-beta hydrolase superfamily lysophospholipase
MKSKKVHFLNSNYEKLYGYIDLPETEPISYAIFAHCFTCSKDLKSIAYINSSLANAGIATLRFDFTGIGESEGDFSESTYTGYINDLILASEYLSANYKAPQLLIGHSLGGCVVIEAVHKIPSVNAVVTLGTPAEPSSLSVKLKRTREKAEKGGFAQTEIGGVKFKFRKRFFEDIEEHILEPYIRNLSKPLLIMHSPVDDYTPIENAFLIFQAAKQPKSFISLDKIDHLMLNKRDAVYAGEVIAAWVRKYFKK